MLKSQEVGLAQSKRRERMAAIQKTDEISEEARAELRSLADAYEGAEIELRASLLLEGAERDKITVPDKAANDFDRECRSFSLANVVASIESGKPLTGREAEVSAELETRHGAAAHGIRFPWESLETRTEVPTTTVDALGGNLALRPTMTALERFFEASAANRFGFQSLQVTGKPSFPEITSGAGAHWVAEGAGNDAEAIGTTTKPASIKTVMSRYLLTRQAVRENSALEMILRRDLSEVLREAVDLACFRGTGANDQPSGLEALLTLTRTDALTAKATFTDFLMYGVQLMEASKTSDLNQIRMAAAPIVLQTLADSLISSTAVSELDRLAKVFPNMTFSSQVSAQGARDATDKGVSNVYFGAGDANAYVCLWGSPELIVDPYSESRSGKVSLTMFSFADILIQRLGSHFFKVSDVQDRT